MQGGLRTRNRLKAEDINPLEGAVNIVDAMLVFACGLMLSLIIHWNVDLGEIQQRVELNQQQEVTQQPQIQNNLIENQDEGGLYEKMGTVYKDPVSGKLFMLTDQ